MRCLGLDISSTTIGWSILDKNKNKIKLTASGYIKPPKDGTLFERLQQTKIEISSILEAYRPEKIAIEDVAQYMPGKSTAHTILLLCTFNRMIGFYCYEFFDKNPELIAVMSIRKILKDYLKLQETPDKEEIPFIVEKILKKKFDWRLNKKGKAIKENYDVADSIAVGLACLIKDRPPI